METTPNRTEGIAACMAHWFNASEASFDQAHNPHISSAGRLEAFRFASRAEARGSRLARLLRADSAERWVREAA